MKHSYYSLHVGRGSAMDENLDMDLDDPEMEVAATKIQAGFRGSKARKEVDELKNKKNIDIKMTLQSMDQMGDEEEYVDEDELVNGISPVDSAVQKDNKNEEEEIDIDLEDPEVEKAATKIQAGFKGHKARKEVKEMRDEREEDVHEEGKYETKEVKDDEEVDIDRNDPNVQAATEKIQAGYKGMRTRRDMKHKTEVKEEEKDDEVVDIDLEDPDVQAATEKIQAGYKGMRTRRDMKDKKKGENIESEENNIRSLKEAKYEEATVIIQSGYRGMKARKDIKKEKAK